MALMLDEEMDENVTTIKVIGVGGGGGNAVNRMVSDGLQGVEFIAMNTDQQALAKNHAATKVQLGSKLTKGAVPVQTPRSASAPLKRARTRSQMRSSSQMVFITAGMGGGTGTGAAPVVAEVAHDLGILTVGIVTKPFSFEGKRKMGLAEQGIANLLMHVDSLIVIPNERLKMISQEKITLMNAFQAADNVLRQGVESISALINVPAFINLDFADVRSIMKDAATHTWAWQCQGRRQGRERRKGCHFFSAAGDQHCRCTRRDHQHHFQPGHRSGRCGDRSRSHYPERTSRCKHHLGYCVRREPLGRDACDRGCYRF